MLPLNKICALVLLAALPAFSPLSLQAAEPVKEAEFTLDPVSIDGKIIAMAGPITRKQVTLAEDLPDEPIWIKSFAVDIDDNGHAGTLEFLCHAWANLGMPTADDQRLLTVSQGHESMDFPEGFGIRLEAPSKSVNLMAQALNDNDDVPHTLTYHMKIGYMSEADAEKAHLQNLRTVTAYVPRWRTADPAQAALKAPADGEMCGAGTADPTMFYVPPGRHVYTAPVQNAAFSGKTARIHYIKLHLHAYGESMSLIDKTDNRVLWKGYAKNSGSKTMVTEVNNYSSSEGIAINPAHQYELEAVYNNTTLKDIDAMAVLRFYMRDEAAPLEQAAR
jgi:hypothetical protein